MWNLARLAETLLPLLDADEAAAITKAEAALERFPPQFEVAYEQGLRGKLGLMQARTGDLALARDLLERMARNKADFTLTFRALAGVVAGPAGGGAARALFENAADFDEWAVQWRDRVSQEGGDTAARQALMRASNPAFIPRNHRVEEAIAAAVIRDDLAPFERLVAVLARPFDDQPGNASYAAPPQPDEIVHQTFCGT